MAVFGTATITGSTIEGNSVTTDETATGGGGIYNQGTLTLTDMHDPGQLGP